MVFLKNPYDQSLRGAEGDVAICNLSSRKVRDCRATLAMTFSKSPIFRNKDVLFGIIKSDNLKREVRRISEMIKKTDFVEDLLEEYDGINSVLMKKGVVCIQCGEPIWGTLEEIIKAKKLDVESIVAELNSIYSEENKNS